MAIDALKRAHEEARRRAEVHEAVARLLERHPELLEDARRRSDSTPPAKSLPSPWRDARTPDEADAYWNLILSFEVEDVAAWILAFADDPLMNDQSPFGPDEPTPMVRRELTVIRRHRKGKAHDNTKQETKLARLRIERDLSQEEMVRLTGLKLSTYWRLERKRIKNPPIGYLAVCAEILEVGLDEIIEDEYLEWRPDRDAGS